MLADGVMYFCFSAIEVIHVLYLHGDLVLQDLVDWVFFANKWMLETSCVFLLFSQCKPLHASRERSIACDIKEFLCAAGVQYVLPGGQEEKSDPCWPEERRQTES